MRFVVSYNVALSGIRIVEAASAADARYQVENTPLSELAQDADTGDVESTECKPEQD